MSNAPNNQLAPRGNNAPATFSSFITGEGVRKKINEMIGGENGHRFITSIVSAVSNNPALAACDHGTILSAALLGESLKLSPSVQLGQFYIVPFRDNKLGRTVATFQIGYKGYIQLAIRSGYYKKLNVIAIKEGELVIYDPLNEEIEVRLIQDDTQRENTPTIGYYAMFEYLNGFRKTLYWSREKMEAHALKYSPGYASDKRKGNRYTFWSKDFDGMAFKTMLRQIISKWGIMSVDLQKAMDGDNAMIVNDTPQYIDAEPADVAPTSLAQPDTAEDDFFSGACAQPEPVPGPADTDAPAQGQPDEEAALAPAIGERADEYVAANAAKRKAIISSVLNASGVQTADMEKKVGKSFAQWTKKDRIALLQAAFDLAQGVDPSEVFPTGQEAA